MILLKIKFKDGAMHEVECKKLIIEEGKITVIQDNLYDTLVYDMDDIAEWRTEYAL